MSELKHMLDVSPDKYGTRVETKHVRGVTCPRCNGRGGFTEEVAYNKSVTIPCDLCDGTGKIKAEVVVEWNADYES